MSTKSRYNFYLPILLTICTLSCICFSSCESAQSSTNKEDILPVKIDKIGILDTTIYQEYVADIQARKHVEIRSKVSGFLEKIYVDEGAIVKKGQLLFSVNAADFRANVQRAEANYSSAQAQLKKAEIELEQSRLLRSKNIISKSELDLSEANYTAAKALVEEARSTLALSKTELSFTDIRAPFDGKIDRFQLREGSLVGEGALLTVLSELDEVYAYFEISEKEYFTLKNSVAEGASSFKTKVRLILANGDMYPEEGVAEFAESSFDSQTGTIALRATFPNKDFYLKHGASGKVLVPNETGELLIVHQKSVIEIQDRHYVFALQEDSTLKMVPFEAGERIGHYYHVIGGLEQNTPIAYEGILNLRDGQKVAPQF